MAIVVLLLVLGGLEVVRRKVSGPTWHGVSSNAVIAVALIAVLVFGVWYVAVYDTAAGRCSRGDFGACLVVESQQAQR